MLVRMDQEVNSLDNRPSYKFPKFFSAAANRSISAPSSKMDILVHLSLWIVVLIFEILFFMKCDDWHKAADANTLPVNSVPFQYAAASLSLVVIAMTTTLVLLALTLGKVIDITHPDAYLNTLMTGPVSVSLIFTIIVVLFAIDINASIVTDQWRTRSIILITFKSMLVTHIKYNFDNSRAK